MTVGGVGQDEQHVLAGLRICGGGGGVETGLGGGGGGGGGCGSGVTVGGLQPLGTVHINFYTSKPHNNASSCTCTFIASNDSLS